MKNTIIIFLFATLFLACGSDDNNNNISNPYLTPPPVNLTLNLSLPEYNSLNFPGNSVVVSNQGIKGIVVSNLNGSIYYAFDLSDPNHSPNSCSRMEVNGGEATCQCEDANKYSIITGQKINGQSPYTMLQYRAEREGDVIRVYN